MYLNLNPKWEYKGKNISGCTYLGPCKAKFIKVQNHHASPPLDAANFELKNKKG